MEIYDSPWDGNLKFQYTHDYGMLGLSWRTNPARFFHWPVYNLD